MRLDFVKMTGAGNDFILADNRAGGIALTREQVAKLCHRQSGIGADGLMLLVPCRSGKAERAWQFWNSDGSDAEMCGHGGTASALKSSGTASTAIALTNCLGAKPN